MSQAASGLTRALHLSYSTRSADKGLDGKTGYAAMGGSFSVTIAAGTYSAQWFDPRTGEEVVLPEVAGGSAVTFKAPDGQDRVLYLRGGKRS